MNDVLRTDVPAMLAAADRVSAAAEVARDGYRSTSSAVGGTTNAWMGTSSAAFAALTARWDEDAAKLDQALTDLTGNIVANAHGYDTTADQNTRDISAIETELLA